MSRRAGKRLLETVLILLLAGLSFFWGWRYLASMDDQAVMAETRALPIPVISGAIHFALGRGVGGIMEREEGFPELEAFLKGEIKEIPRSAYPEVREGIRGSGHYLDMHYYLIAYLGLIFRLLGISVWSFKIACIMLHVLAMILLYGIFRLAMGPILGILFSLILAHSRAFLFMLPSLRDYGKAPFLFAALLLMGMIVKRARTPGRLCGVSALLGVVVGIGYGFRQDVFVCLPVAVVCICFGPRFSCRRPWLVRSVAVLLLAAFYGVFATPVFKGDREVGSTIAVHTLFQGLMVCAEQNASFGSASYDFGF